MNIHLPSDPFEAVAAEPRRTTGGDPFGVRGFVRIARRRWRVIAIVAGIVAALIIGRAMVQTPVYQSTAQIMISPKQERVVRSDEQMVVDGGDSTATIVDSEVELLRSPQLARRLVDKLNLKHAPAPWLNIVPNGIRPPSLGQNASATAREALAQQLLKAMRVERRGMTLAIDVSAFAPDPKSAAALANGLVEVYLEVKAEERSDMTKRASAWLGERLVTLRAELQAKEAAAEQFRAQSGLLSTSGTTLTEQQLAEAQGAVLAARADVAEKQARYRQVQNVLEKGDSADTIADVLNSAAIRDLRARQADLERERAQLETKYRPGHPALANNSAQVANVQKQVDAEIVRISISLRNEVDVSNTRLKTLESSLSSARGEMVGNNGALVRLRELEREASAAKAVYESFLQRQQEITNQDRLDAADARQISAAAPGLLPVAPNRFLAVILGIAAGLIMGILFAVARELFDQTITSADDLRDRVGVTVLSSVPALTRKMLGGVTPPTPASYLVEKQMSNFAETLRVLRTAINYADTDRRASTVAITSALPNEGKTTIAVCLARVAAMSGQSVLVIDCDLRRRSMTDLLQIEPAQGLLQVLAEEVTWRGAIVKDRETSAHFLPLAPAGFTPRDIFGSVAMQRLVDELQGAYDLVIFDCAPILAIADTRLLVGLADQTLLIARWRKTSYGALQAAVKATQDVGGRITGVAVNCVSPGLMGRSAYDESLYYYKAREGYYVN